MKGGRSVRAGRLLSPLLSIGWRIKRQSGSHRVLEKEGWADAVFALHDREETGPRMLAVSPRTLDLILRTWSTSETS